jgi:hypothetical protein
VFKGFDRRSGSFLTAESEKGLFNCKELFPFTLMVNGMMIAFFNQQQQNRHQTIRTQFVVGRAFMPSAK